jgi:predicted naringenin-chalcone synthase
MPAALWAIGTALPAHRAPQTAIRSFMGRLVGGDRRTDKLLDRVYRASAIEARHSVLADFTTGEGIYLTRDGARRTPSTGERNALYVQHASDLAEAAARDAFARCRGATPARVTHLVTVSCTGFSAPGVDLDLVARLGLPRSVARTHVGFMGCFAAFPALRLARAFCAEDPHALVLIVAVELCTLHLQASDDPDAVLAASVFADGAAALLVAAAPPGEPTARVLTIERTASALTQGGATDMAWTIGDHGFAMTLSSYVPRVVEAEIAAALAPLLDDAGVAVADVPWWAVHPGGRAIVDRVEAALALPPEAVAAARSVLRSAGNMSSVTVPFVLAALTDPNRPGPAPGERVVAVAFGPGLTVDSALLRAT